MNETVVFRRRPALSLDRDGDRLSRDLNDALRYLRGRFDWA
jgi:hypothetical protein